MQLLSEPSGGSDLAGVITRAEQVGDKWVINGAKTWSTSAFAADYGLMLARTDWDVPKHEGLTMFLVPHSSPASHAARQQVDGSVEFCEEFFDNVDSATTRSSARSTRAGTSRRASSTTSDARSAAARNSPVASAPKARPTYRVDYVALLAATGQADNERARKRWRAGLWSTGRCASS